MATSKTEVESQVAELATEAFNIFCDDIGSMFGVDMQCEQKEVRSETVQGLKKRFKKLVAVNVVQSEGSLSGTFQLIFDQEGLFTLGGVIVMLPEQRILANRRDPSPELAASMVDAVAEAGNLLVGSWDRVFREGLKKHGHFLQRLPAFVGRPWDEPKEKIGLAADEDLLYIAYEMTIGSYPAFNCGVIFPKTIFGGSSGLPRDDGVLTAENAARPGPALTGVLSAAEGPNDSQDAETVPQAQDNAGEADQKPVGAEVTPAQKAQAEEKSPETPSNNAPAGKAKPKQADAAQKREGGKSKSKRRAAGKTARKKANVTAAAGETGAEETTEAKAAEAQIPPTSVTTSEKNEDPATGKISETIRRMTQSPAVLPGESGQPSPAAPESTDLASQPSPAAPELTDLPGQPATPECAPLRASASGGLLSMPARDVMKDHVVWATPEETVQQALAKMQQHDTGYLMVGRDGMLEGMVSRSDVAGALSPYLRSIFAKWRRPLDDATLKIKIKWIMSRPVRTVRPETPLATIMENMCRFGGRAVPVVDEQGKVQGLVTVFDVFQTLLKTCDDVSTVGNAPQSPPLT